MANTRRVQGRIVHPQPGRPVPPKPRPPAQVAPFDLDAFEADGAREPFRFLLGGEEFSMADLDSADWQELESAVGTGDLMLIVLGDEQYERFCTHPASTAKMNALIKAAMEYYGAGEGSA